MHFATYTDKAVNSFVRKKFYRRLLSGYILGAKPPKLALLNRVKSWSKPGPKLNQTTKLRQEFLTIIPKLYFHTALTRVSCLITLLTSTVLILQSGSDNLLENTLDTARVKSWDLVLKFKV